MFRLLKQNAIYWMSYKQHRDREDQTQDTADAMWGEGLHSHTLPSGCALTWRRRRGLFYKGRNRIHETSVLRT